MSKDINPFEIEEEKVEEKIETKEIKEPKEDKPKEKVEIKEEQIETKDNPIIEYPGDVGKEVLIETKFKKKDGYWYYIDRFGNVCRKKNSERKKQKKRVVKKKQIINYFDRIDLTVPRICLSGWASNKFKRVRKAGKTAGVIGVPHILIGKEFQVILIPKEDWILHQTGKINTITSDD